MSNEQLKKIAIYLGTILVALILVSLLLRNAIFSFYLNRKVDHFNNNYNCILKIDKAKIHGVSDVLFTGISLKPIEGDTLLVIDSASATLSFWKLVFGKVIARDLQLSKARIILTQKDSVTNYQFLISKKKPKNPEDSLVKRNYANVFSQLSDAVFGRLPATLKINDITLSYDKNGHKISFHVDHFVADHHAFHTAVKVTEGDTAKNWIIAGSFDNENSSTGFRLYSADKEKISIPYIGYNLKTAIAFDTLTFMFKEEDKGDDLFHMKGMTLFTGLEIQQERISAKKVAFDRLGMEYVINIGSDYLEIDSATQIFFNRLSFHPYIKYRAKPTKQITFSIVKSDFPAEELFSSLPEDLFSTAKGIKVNGKLSFSLDFFVDLSIPDSLRMNVDMKRNHFGVISYGNAGLTKLNSDFVYTAYERGVPTRSFIVGPENPEFRSLNKISQYLQISVLNSEDPGFYQHRGFIPEAFRESMILNIKERRFARGGSTITMQLVKNVFLNRNKTIARKLEEILLVWLIENQQLCSKERMFEVYLNIIELGPHVYGANEATHFYFKKDASKLNLQESIFLASIIPKPKWFMYSFDKSGNLNQSTKDFMMLLSGKMLRKGQITQKEYDNLVTEITLKGPANGLLKTEVPVKVDDDSEE